MQPTARLAYRAGLKMQLVKARTPGTPLSEAERRQRRDAARARWAVLGGGTVGGGGIGAAVSVARRTRAGPREMVAAIEVANQAVSAGHTARQTSLNDLIRNRLRAIGTPNSKPLRVYDYQVQQLDRRLARAEFNGNAQQARGLRQQIGRLVQLGAKAPQVRGRASTVRFANRAAGEAHLATLDAQIEHAGNLGQHAEAVRLELLREEAQDAINTAHPVVAHTMRAFRGGETAKQITRRVSSTKAELAARHRTLLTTLERRTAQLRATVQAATINDTERLLDARMLRAGGRGAAIGAAIGLTAAGLGLIAHHVAHSEGRRGLRKATEDSPEASIGKGVAETFREWIDRLLGRSMKPLNVGDGMSRALVPGITQAFANGATQPPAPAPPGEQNYTVAVDFDQLNPSVRRHMADYALDRIVDISNDQREAIRKTLMDQSVLQGIGPREVARSLRESIGLTPYQSAIVKGYRTELEALDPAALERKLRDARYDKTVRRAIETGKPLSAEQIDAMVDAYYRRMLAKRAETIARTESIRATSYGAVARAQDVLDQNPDLDVIKRWIATDDGRTRPTHVDLDGKEVRGMLTPFRTSAGNLVRWPIDSEAAADECINCLLPGTRVFAPGLRAVSRREFDGEIIAFKTADGSQLSCTINHPILTVNGWTAAQFLQEGDRVVCGSEGDWGAKVYNHDHRHPRIEDIEHALRLAGSPTATKVAMLMDFHGEGIGGQVDVTVADHDLVGADYALGSEHFAKENFLGTDFVAHTLARCSAFRTPLGRFSASTNSGVSGSDLRLAQGLRHLAPLQSLSFAAAPNSAAIYGQDMVNGGARNAALLREYVHRSAGVITIQQIVHVARKPWSGHVYNLETLSGTYFAENIGNHNCRCSIAFRFIPMAAATRSNLMAEAV